MTAYHVRISDKVGETLDPGVVYLSLETLAVSLLSPCGCGTAITIPNAGGSPSLVGPPATPTVERDLFCPKCGRTFRIRRGNAIETDFGLANARASA